MPRLLALAAVLVALASSGTARVQYAPAVQVEPTTAAAGEEVTLRGGGFAPGETVTVRTEHVDGTAVPDVWTATADGTGAFETSWSMPGSSGRQFRVEAAGAVSGPSRPVAVTRGPVVVTDRREYVAGDGVWISGRDFAPGEVVTVQVTHADGTAEPGMGHSPQDLVAGPDGGFQLGWMVGAADLAGPQFVVGAAGAVSGTARPAPFARIAALRTDKGDYQPGETALITGNGFAPNELVTLQVVHANGQNDGNGHEPFLAAADAAGNVAASWYVDPDDSLGSKFVLTGLGQTSGVGGRATFWDAGTVSLTGAPYSQDFNSLATSGTANTTLPLGWDVSEAGGGSRDNEAYAAGTGSDNTGDTYSFGAAASTERALGGLRSGTLVPTVGAQFTNDTGTAITSLTIAFTAEQWRLGQNTAGRLADRFDFELSTTATSLTSGTWTSYDALDVVSPTVAGTVGLLDGNATANRIVVATALSGLNIGPGTTFWIRWTDVDLVPGADDGLAIDDFALTTNPGPVGDVSVTVDTLDGDAAEAGAAPGAVRISRTGATTAALTVAYALGGSASAADYTPALTGTAVIPVGAAHVDLIVTPVDDAEVEGTETLSVTAIDGPDYDLGASVSAAITIADNDVAVSVVRIHAVQGSGATAASGTFTVEGIVVGDYQSQGSGQLRGFFVQEEDADADLDPATSEGLFVFCSACPAAVAVGDAVRVTGSSSEFFGMSQLSATTAASVVVLSNGNPLPTPAHVELPVPGVPAGDLAAATAAINAYFEPLEGMLVRFSDTLAVSEYFELARYGQLILSQGGRPRQFTDTQTPTAAGFINHQIDLARRTVVLDDTDNRQNRPVDSPNTAYYHPAPGLSTTNVVRGGDTIANLTGVLHWSFAGQTGTDAWRIRPVAEAYSYAFTATNPRPAPPAVGGRLRVASFNVLNYFPTIDTTSSDSNGACGASATLDCRGADSVNEFTRQRAKLTQALLGLDADVVGLIEMENTPGVSPAQQIVDDLNAVVGAGTYAVIDTGVIGTDAIRVGLIYKPATVAPAGAHAVLTSAVDPEFIDTANRPALAQTFDERATGARFTVAVNHLKSKGSGCGPGDDDVTTGQGNCNLTRTRAAAALARWLATDPTGSGDRDVLVIGDLNSYAKEDPVTALFAAGYVDLVAQFGGGSGYSYVFDGQLGYLDHALANVSLRPQVSGVAEWHINADEIPLFDYNDEVRDTGESAFEEESDALPLYDALDPNPFRTSDHDPIVIGLALTNSPPTASAGGPYGVVEGASIALSATGADPDGTTVTFAWDLDDNGSFEAAGPTVTFSTAGRTSPNSYPVKVKVTDATGASTVAASTVTVRYAFTGFLWPVYNLPVVNRVKAGWIVPLRFSLGGNKGGGIFAGGSPTTEVIPCAATASLVTLGEAGDVNGGLLWYNPFTKRYLYLWKSQKAWAGTCRQLVVRFADGTTQRADFQFVK